MDGIQRPVFANFLNNGNWIIGNSSIFLDEEIANGTQTSISVQVGNSQSISVEVDAPEDGFFVQWQSKIPAQAQEFVSFSAPPPGNRATINIDSPTSEAVGEYTLTFIAEYRDINTQSVVSSTQNQLLLIVTESSDSTGGNDSTGQSSIIEINHETEEIGFNYDSVKFSDFSLGSVYEIDDNNFLIAGIIQNDDTLTEPTGGIGAESFESQAARKLQQFRGKVIVVDRSSKSISFQYDTPDGSYASDAVIDDNSNFVVAETSFVSNSGRIVKLDSFGNVIFQIGGGLFSKINDVRAMNNGNVVIST